MRRRGNLLVVDDESTILNTLKKALSLEGYRVDVAGGAKLAMERLCTTDYDLLLLDVALPDGDGLEVLEQTHNQNPKLPVVMMSGHATIDTAVKATQLGALDFLEKPLSTDRLLLVVDNILRLSRAEAESHELKREAGHFDELLGQSVAMQRFREQLSRAARSNVPVLLAGERGTGKELAARAVHRASERRDNAMEKLNCAAIPKDLIESELFGHEAGAFTGATKMRRGRFERAHGGTLFLDEVGDMPLGMQAKLLRVLQEQEFERVGGTEVRRVDVRVVAASNKDLTQACEDGNFRPDLLDRLNVVPLRLPPLRDRAGDIELLSRRFLETARTAHNRPNVSLTPKALQELASHPFPGNVRELKNALDRLVILSPVAEIDAKIVKEALGLSSSSKASQLYRPNTPYRELVEAAERMILTQALQANGGQMAATARALGLERSHLYKKTKTLGLREVTSEHN